MDNAIWWIRRDLRLNDNAALQAAVSKGFTIIPCFILDPVLIKNSAPRRLDFLLGGLESLSKALQQDGSLLIIRSGSPTEALQKLVQETGAHAVFAEEDFSPYAVLRDSLVSHRVPLRLIHGLTVHHPAAVKKADGNPYTVFTPFSKTWKSLPFPTGSKPAGKSITPFPPLNLQSDPLPPHKPHPAFIPGEPEAQRRLAQFLSGPIYEYTEGRNRLDLDGGSFLSPYFKFGMLSLRVAASSAYEAAKTAPDTPSRLGAETWLNELIWREFFISIVYYFPSVLKGAFNPSLRGIPWLDSQADLQNWQAGLTGYPVVDAAMRQLASTGFMHNRARMITASFLTKDLLINWQEGEKWFMANLIDGEIAANNGGWQWTAGTGTDAAPYFRIFNPILQGIKFDPQGNYVRKWVPELAGLSSADIHSPWAKDPNLLKQINYPPPIIDHALARDRTLAAYRLSKMEIL